MLYLINISIRLVCVLIVNSCRQKAELFAANALSLSLHWQAIANAGDLVLLAPPQPSDCPHFHLHFSIIALSVFAFKFKMKLEQ